VVHVPSGKKAKAMGGRMALAARTGKKKWGEKDKNIKLTTRNRGCQGEKMTLSEREKENRRNNSAGKFQGEKTKREHRRGKKVGGPQR